MCPNRLELGILLHWSLRCWDYGCVAFYSTYFRIYWWPKEKHTSRIILETGNSRTLTYQPPLDSLNTLVLAQKPLVTLVVLPDHLFIERKSNVKARKVVIYLKFTQEVGSSQTRITWFLVLCSTTHILSSKKIQKSGLSSPFVLKLHFQESIFKDSHRAIQFKEGKTQGRYSSKSEPLLVHYEPIV